MKKSFRSFLRAMGLWRHMDAQLIVSCLASALAEALSPLSTIYLSARLISELAGQREPEALAKWIALILLAQGITQLLSALCRKWKNSRTALFELRQWNPFQEKLSKMDYCQLQRQYVTGLFSQVRQNTMFGGWGLGKVISIFNEQLLPGLFLFLGGIALSVSLFSSKVEAGGPLAFLNAPIFALLLPAALIAAAALTAYLRGQGDRTFTDFAPSAKFGNRIFGFFLDVSQDRRRSLDVRLYGQQAGIAKPMFRRYDPYSAKGEFGKLLYRKTGPLFALSAVVTTVLTGFIYLFVCLKAWGGAFGVGEITQYVGAITQCFLGVSSLLAGLAAIKVNGPFLDTVFALLDVPNTMYQGSLTTEKRSDRQYEIEFRDVSFRYPDTDTDVLRHVNMKFKVGSRLAVVGQNGSGKTTFIKLLCRLYDPTEGQILLNGIDIRKYKYDEYMDIFAVVFQDFKLFALPLGKNVASSAAYDRAQAAQCLHDAGFGEKYSLDTVLYKDLDSQGVEISGGEAQKIAIARALYKDAPFIILDEPTAALDPMAEAEIYEKFDAIAGDKTAIYISHRLSSCKFCDEIVVFDHGQVVQMGTHADLVADESGKYYALWHAQAQYYTEK